MEKRFSSRRNRTLALGLALVWFLGVSPVVAEQGSSPASSSAQGQIGLMPFFKGSYGSSITETLVCPVCQLYYDPAVLAPDCDKVLTQYFQQALEQKYGNLVVPQALVARTYAEIPIDDIRDTPLSVSLKVGKLLGTKFMAVGSVWRYRDRVGGDRAASRPASVAFALHLVETGTGKILWSRSFVQTQRSLSENLLNAKAFFDQGAKWVTADELASYGVKEILKDFPY
jgi:hypothetical protein